MKSTLKIPLGLLILLVSACGESTHESSEIAVMGGKIDTANNFKFVGRLTTQMNQGFGLVDNLCGASLIRPDVIVTASHCIDDTLAMKNGHFEIEGERMGLSAYVKVGGKTPAYYDDRTAEHADLALIRLERAISAKPVSMYSGMPVTERLKPMGSAEYLELLAGGSLPLLGVGYGSTVDQDSAEPDKKGERNFSYLNYRGYWGANEGDLVIGSRYHTLCLGDSGGALLIRDSNEWFLAGVHSRTLAYDGIEPLTPESPTCSKANGPSLAVNLDKVDLDRLIEALPRPTPLPEPTYSAKVRALNYSAAFDTTPNTNECPNGPSRPYAAVDTCRSGADAYVGYVQPKEWLLYETGLAKFPNFATGRYRLTLEMATRATSDRCFTLAAVEANERETVILKSQDGSCIQDTGGWELFKDKSFEISLDSKYKALKFIFQNNEMNFKSFSLQSL